MKLIKQLTYRRLISLSAYTIDLLCKPGLILLDHEAYQGADLLRMEWGKVHIWLYYYFCK